MKLFIPYLLIASTLTARVNAVEINDYVFGFRVEVPETFVELEADSSDPDTIHKYIEREPAPNQPACVIQIQRLRGLIGLDSRMADTEIPVEQGVATTVQEYVWRDHKMDVLRQTLTLQTDIQYVVFGIQYPLSGEAVQVQVGGPQARESEVHSLFSRVATSFLNDKPLYAPDKPVTVITRELSTDERFSKLMRGTIKLAITVVAVVFLLLVLMRAISKKKEG